MADWDDGATHAQKQIIAHGTSHHLFTGTATQLVINAVKSEAHIPPHVMSQFKEWVDQCVSAIDERVFTNAFKSKADQMDDKLNAIINNAINHYTSRK